MHVTDTGAHAAAADGRRGGARGTAHGASSTPLISSRSSAFVSPRAGPRRADVVGCQERATLCAVHALMDGHAPASESAHAPPSRLNEHGPQLRMGHSCLCRLGPSARGARGGSAHGSCACVCVFVFVFVFVCSCASSVVGIVRSFVSCSCFAVVEVLRARVLSVTVCALSRAHHLHLSAVWRYGPDSWGGAGSLGSCVVT